MSTPPPHTNLKSGDQTNMASTLETTTVTYHIDDEDIPCQGKISKTPSEITLGDFKKIIPQKYHKHKFFFKNKDDEFGIVKQEITDDNANLPLFDGRIVSWLVATEGSMISEGGLSGLERGPGVGQTRPPSFHGPRNNMMVHQDDLDEDTESAITSVSQQAANMRSRRNRMPNGSSSHNRHNHGGGHGGLPPLPGPGIQPPGQRLAATETETSSSMMSSEIESSIYESEDVQSQASSSRFTSDTDHTSVSRQNLRHRPKKRSSRKVPARLNRAGSMSSVTDSTMSEMVITVTLNMDTVNFLGISIVGQSNKDGQGDCGIYVGSIMKGGAVALDGRIDPGDMILQVNEIGFDNMSNDDAVRVLKEVVQKPGPIKLVVAKCWADSGTSSAKGYLTLPRQEPVRPIDPGAWVAHTAAVREQYGSLPPPPPASVLEDPLVTGASREQLIPLGDYLGRAPSLTTLSATSIVSSQPDTEKFVSLHHQPQPRIEHQIDGAPINDILPLTKDSGILAITKRMRHPNSGLEVKDRTWLKLKICNAFLGSDLVEWLHEKVEGFQDRREARKYAVSMLKQGLIKDTVNKSNFSEQCYFTFGNDPSRMQPNLGQLNLNDSGLSGESQAQPFQPPMTSLPLGSAGSGGSGGGIWGVGPMPTAPPGPNPKTHDVWTGGQTSGSTTTYGPIYNPAAPPPSATYFNGAWGGVAPPPPAGSSHSGGSGSQRGGNNRLILAGSGSGSESASDGRSSSIMGSDKSSLIRNQGLRPGSLSNQTARPQAVFQGQL